MRRKNRQNRVPLDGGCLERLEVSTTPGLLQYSKSLVSKLTRPDCFLSCLPVGHTAKGSEEAFVFLFSSIKVDGTQSFDPKALTN